VGRQPSQPGEGTHRLKPAISANSARG
jgi:hypothetical protein